MFAAVAEEKLGVGQNISSFPAVSLFGGNGRGFANASSPPPAFAAETYADVVWALVFGSKPMPEKQSL